MINCQTVTELVTDYLEGKLSLWDRLHFWMHISMCKHCREYLRQMKQTTKVLGKVPETPVPKDVHDKLMALLSHSSSPSVPPNNTANPSNASTQPPDRR